MTSQNIELPFFPQFQTEHVAEGAIRATWFEPRFSQSHYNVHNRPDGSHACTLIAVLMAARCHQYNVTINHPLEDLNVRLVHLMAISMLEGNRIHEELRRQKVLKEVNLNVPEALKYTQKDTCNLVEWRSSVYMQRMSRSLYHNLKRHYMEWLKWNSSHNNLFVILIADARTVLFLFQRDTNTVSLFDSHQHTLAQGAFVATAMKEHLPHLCLWFHGVVKECYHAADPKLYELSFLYFADEKL